MVEEDAQEEDALEDLEDEEALEGEEGKGKKKALPIMLIAIASVVLLAVGIGAYFFLFADGEDEEYAQFVAAQEPEFFKELPTITVNLNTDSGPAAYLKASISLELSREQDILGIDPRMPKVMDIFQVYMRELRKSDLQGSAGVFRLKNELLRRINLVVEPIEVKGILFSELIVQ